MLGYYAMPGRGNVPCLIYVTFNNRVTVYHSIHMSQIGATDLVDTLEKREDRLADLFTHFNIDGRFCAIS